MLAALTSPRWLLHTFSFGDIRGPTVGAELEKTRDQHLNCRTASGKIFGQCGTLVGHWRTEKNPKRRLAGWLYSSW